MCFVGFYALLRHTVELLRPGEDKDKLDAVSSQLLIQLNARVACVNNKYVAALAIVTRQAYDAHMEAYDPLSMPPLEYMLNNPLTQSELLHFLHRVFLRIRTLAPGHFFFSEDKPRFLGLANGYDAIVEGLD